MAPSPSGDEPNSRAAAGKNRSVLIVDDDESVRYLLRRYLADAGYQVQEAEDGKQATRMYRQRPADLVVLDLVMPDQEGLETIRVLRQEFPGVRIVAISGAFLGGFLPVATALGAKAALEKPIEQTLFLKTVQDLIG